MIDDTTWCNETHTPDSTGFRCVFCRAAIPQAIDEAEARQFLDDIFSDRLTITALDNPEDVFAGNVEYAVSNGWKIVVFNDCNDWDYVDSIVAPDGRKIEYGAYPQSPEGFCCLFDLYGPTEEQLTRVWKF